MEEDNHDWELKQELNEKYGEEDIDDLIEEDRPLNPFYKVIAFLVVAAFLGYAFSHWIPYFTWRFSGGPEQGHQVASEWKVEELEKSVVLLKAITPDGEKQGTGFNIREDGLIVTNRHLVEGASFIAVSFLEKGGYQAVSWGYSEEYDLAVLKLDAEGLPFVDLQTKRNLTDSDRLLVIGNPLRYRRIASEGHFAGYMERAGVRQVLLVSAPIFPGSSGSPIFDEERKVVGVAYAVLQQGLDQEEILGLAVPASEITFFLNDIE